LSKNESWKTWILVAALLIFAGLASATVPFLVDQLSASREAESETLAESHPTVTTVDVSQLPFIGEVLVEIPFIAANIQAYRLRWSRLLVCFLVSFSSLWGPWV